MAVDPNLAEIQKQLAVERFYSGTTSQVLLAPGSFEPGVMNDATQQAIADLKKYAAMDGFGDDIDAYIGIQLAPEAAGESASDFRKAWSGFSGGAINDLGEAKHSRHIAGLQDVMRDMGVYSGHVDGMDTPAFGAALAKIFEAIFGDFGGNFDKYLAANAGDRAEDFKAHYAGYVAKNGDALQIAGMTTVAEASDARTAQLDGEAGGRDVTAKADLGDTGLLAFFNRVAPDADPAGAQTFEDKLALRHPNQ